MYFATTGRSILNLHNKTSQHRLLLILNHCRCTQVRSLDDARDAVLTLQREREGFWKWMMCLADLPLLDTKGKIFKCQGRQPYFNIPFISYLSISLERGNQEGEDISCQSYTSPRELVSFFALERDNIIVNSVYCVVTNREFV